MSPNRGDVVVIGAGAAGLMAAARAAGRGLKTLLVEKNRKIGVKILMSGGTRCNLTQQTDARGIVAAFGRQGSFLHSALARLDPEGLVALFHQAGVATKVEGTGKVFPVSDSAVDVRDALVRLTRQAGCEIRTDCAVTDLRRDAEGFSLVTSHEVLRARNVIVTTGGQSYPGCGTTGDGYRWLEQMGHSLIAPVPALVPIVIGEQWPRELSGITLDDVALEVRRVSQLV